MHESMHKTYTKCTCAQTGAWTSFAPTFAQPHTKKGTFSGAWQIWGCVKTYYHWLVVWATPLKNMSSSIGMMKFPIYGKIKLMFQTTNLLSSIFSGMNPSIYRRFWGSLGTWLLTHCHRTEGTSWGPETPPATEMFTDSWYYPLPKSTAFSG